VTVLTVPPAPRSQTTVLFWKASPVVEQGWKKLESRKSRRKRLKAATPPHRRVTADLVDRCFNCFSPSHLASQCRQKTRCFHCCGLGHRSSTCLYLRCGELMHDKMLKPKPRAMVWKRKVMPVASATVSPPLLLRGRVWMPKVAPEVASLAFQSPPPSSGGAVAVGSKNSNKHRHRQPQKQRASTRECQEHPASPALAASDIQGLPLCLTSPDRDVSLIVRLKLQEQSRSFAGPFWSPLSVTQGHRRCSF
jgi:hypothetical protein